MQASARLNARGFDGLNLNKLRYQRRKKLRGRGALAHSAAYNLPHGVFRSCICSMNLLVPKREILMDDALVAGQELGRSGVLQGEMIAK